MSRGGAVAGVTVTPDLRGGLRLHVGDGFIAVFPMVEDNHGAVFTDHEGSEAADRRQGIAIGTGVAVRRRTVGVGVLGSGKNIILIKRDEILFDHGRRGMRVLDKTKETSDRAQSSEPSHERETSEVKGVLIHWAWAVGLKKGQKINVADAARRRAVDVGQRTQLAA